MATVYRPGDKLYERTNQKDADHRLKRIVREWTVLSVVTDPFYADVDGTPCQVVTLRAFTRTAAMYMAEIAPILDIKAWSREKPEAA